MKTRIGVLAIALLSLVMIMTVVQPSDAQADSERGGGIQPLLMMLTP